MVTMTASSDWEHEKRGVIMMIVYTVSAATENKCYNMLRPLCNFLFWPMASGGGVSCG